MVMFEVVICILGIIYLWVMWYRVRKQVSLFSVVVNIVVTSLLVYYIIGVLK
jgi:hypothetical protein